MQQALEALNRSDYLGWQLNIPIIKALRERLAQPEQEPVWIQPNHLQLARRAPFLCRVEPKQRDDFVPLYTAPRREWVGLTDEEIKEIIGPWGDTPIKGYTRKLFDQIEAKLKEKNQ
jgi:hypothetical protein